MNKVTTQLGFLLSDDNKVREEKMGDREKCRRTGMTQNACTLSVLKMRIIVTDKVSETMSK